MVSMLISAYNEEKYMREKILNFFALDYPPERIELIVGSDGSDDRTSDIIRGFEDTRIILFTSTERWGKARMLNQLAQIAKGDILVFSDANTDIKKNAIRKMIRHFEDGRVGGVCGELMLYGMEKGPGTQSLYWRFERALKRLEGRLGLSLGANGAIYCIRKPLYVPLPDDTIIDDFFLAMQALGRGYRFHYDPEALAREETTEKMGQQVKRHIRIATGDYQFLFRHGRLLFPRYPLLYFSYISHKVMRWLSPFFLVILLLSNLALAFHSLWYSGLLVLQGGGYLMGLMGYLETRGGGPSKSRILTVSCFAFMLQYTLVVGLFRYLFGKRGTVKGWEKTR